MVGTKFGPVKTYFALETEIYVFDMPAQQFCLTYEFQSLDLCSIKPTKNMTNCYIKACAYDLCSKQTFFIALLISEVNFDTFGFI